MAASELFTVTWWEVTATQVINAAAGAAAGALVAAGAGLIGDVPWYAVVSQAAISGGTALLLALAGKANPATGPASLFIPSAPAAKRAARKSAAARKPKPLG